MTRCMKYSSVLSVHSSPSEKIQAVLTHVHVEDYIFYGSS
jgi:hypothetical protein